MNIFNKLWNRSQSQKPDTLAPLPEDTSLSEVSKTLYLDGRVIKASQLVKRITVILEPKNLITTGGILFKSEISGDVFELGILPQFFEGERGYHYDIHLKGENEFSLIGSLTAQRELTILFKCLEMTDEKRAVYRKNYRAIARLFDLCSGSNEIQLDWITTKLMEDQLIYRQTPSTLKEIINFRE